MTAHLLEGIRVIDMGGFIAGPGAATLMADYGADVIKIEPPGGDGYRRLHGQYETDYYWQLTSRNKRGFALDVSTRAGRDVLQRLLADADVLITNFREKQLERFALQYDDLHTSFPRLICAQVTGFGSTGLEKDRRGYDATAWWARSGIMQLMKKPGEPPVFPAGGVGDHATAMTLFAGIMMALYKRKSTGEGSQVETSLIGSGCWANGMALQGAIAGFDLAAQVEKHDNRSPFAMVYQTRDHCHLVLVLTNPVKEWPDLATALGHPEWLNDERFSNHRAVLKRRQEVRAMIDEVMGAMTLSEVCTVLDEFKLTYGVVEGLTDVVTDAHLIDSKVLVPTESSDPNFAWTIACPIKIRGEAQRKVGDPPGFGEDTIDLLHQAGFGEAEITTLLAEKIVFSAT